MEAWTDGISFRGTQTNTMAEIQRGDDRDVRKSRIERCTERHVGAQKYIHLEVRV